MKAAALCLATITLVSLCPTAQGQSQVPMTSEEKAQLLDLQRPLYYHPKLSLQDALKVAEKFIISENIDTAHFWLYRATFTLHSSEPGKKAVRGWHFWWMNDSGVQGNYVYIFVSMDGQCRRLPSMLEQRF